MLGALPGMITATGSPIQYDTMYIAAYDCFCLFQARRRMHVPLSFVRRPRFRITSDVMDKVNWSVFLASYKLHVL